jgi:hypothetical protein
MHCTSANIPAVSPHAPPVAAVSTRRALGLQATVPGAAGLTAASEACLRDLASGLGVGQLSQVPAQRRVRRLLVLQTLTARLAAPKEPPGSPVRAVEAH